MPTTAVDILCSTCPTDIQGEWCDFTDAGCGIGSLWDNGMVAQNDIATTLARGASIEARVKDFDMRELYKPAVPLDHTRTDHCDPCRGPTEIEEVLRRQEVGDCFAEDFTARWCQGCDDERAIDATFNELNRIRQFQYEHRAMCTVMGGIYGSDLAAGRDNINDLTTDPYGLGTTFSRLNALKAMGDKDCDEIDAILVHPVVYTNKMCEGFVECPCPEDGTRASFLQGPNGERMYKAGKNVKDKLVVGGNYVSIGYQNGVLKYGEGCTTDPVLRHYEPCEKTWYIHTNNRFVLHPCGYTWTGTQETVEGLTDADLALAANWEAVGNVPRFQFFITTG